jgi:uncharacterized membrane protein
LSNIAPVSAPHAPRPRRFSRRRQRTDLLKPYDAGWRERLLVLGLVVGGLTAGLILGLMFAPGATAELVGLIPLSMFAIGKFLPLWGVSGESHFGPWELGLVIWVLDTCTVLLFVYGLEALYYFDRLRRPLEKVQANAGLVLRAYPRIRRVAVVGVALFVLFPVAGTGAMSGAFLAILLGLKRHVAILAVSLGGLGGGMLMAFLAVFFSEAATEFQHLQDNPLVKWGSMAVVAVLLLLAVRWLSRAYRRAIDEAKQQQASEDSQEAELPSEQRAAQ